MALAPPTDYERLSVRLAVCDELKDAEKGYSADAAELLTPEHLRGVVNFERAKVPTKEQLISEILQIEGPAGTWTDINYLQIQNMAVGATAAVKVKFSGLEYDVRCFANNNTDAPVASTQVNDWMGDGIRIVRITDTTRHGDEYMATAPNTTLHGHTILVENDQCGKLRINPNLWAKYYVEEFAPDAGGGFPKVVFNPWRNSNDYADTTRHMVLDTTIIIEYRGMDNNGKLKLTMTVMSPSGKPMLVDEKMNTAGAFEKIKASLKSAFNIKTGKELQYVIQASKLNGDQGQVLEMLRSIKLQNLAILQGNAVDGVPAEVSTDDYIIEVEAYDFNLFQKWLLEGGDVFKLHLWPAEPERFAQFKNRRLNTPEIQLANLKAQFESLYVAVRNEIVVYNSKLGKINTNYTRFMEILDEAPQVISILGDAKMSVSFSYSSHLKKWAQAAVLSEYLPTSLLDAVGALPNDIPVADAGTTEDKIQFYKDQIQNMNQRRTALKIPSEYTKLDVIKGVNLADVDLEKIVLLNTTGAKVGSYFEKVDITQDITTPREKAFLNTANALYGISIIQFIKEKMFRFRDKYLNMWKNLFNIASLNVDSNKSIARIMGIDLFKADFIEAGLVVAAHGGRSDEIESRTVTTANIEALRKNFSKNISNLRENLSQTRRRVSKAKKNLNKKLSRKLRKITKILEQEINHIVEDARSSNINGVSEANNSQTKGIPRGRLETIQEVSKETNNTASLSVSDTNKANNKASKEEDTFIKYTYTDKSGVTTDFIVYDSETLRFLRESINEMKGLLTLCEKVRNTDSDEETKTAVSEYLALGQKGGRIEKEKFNDYSVYYNTRKKKHPKITKENWDGKEKKIRFLGNITNPRAKTFYKERLREYEKARTRNLQRSLAIVREKRKKDATDSVDFKNFSSTFCPIAYDIEVFGMGLVDTLNEMRERINTLRASEIREQRIHEIDVMIGEIEYILTFPNACSLEYRP